MVEVGLEHHNLVARLDQRQHRRGDGLGRTGGDQHLGVGIDLQAVEASLVVGHRPAQRWDAQAGRVLVVAGTHRSHCRLEDRVGPVGVGEALAEVDGAGARRQLGHLREDRGAEALEALDEVGVALAHRCHGSGGAR